MKVKLFLIVWVLSLVSCKTKQIPVPYEVPVPVEVEKELTLLQRLKIRVGEIAIVFVLFYVIFKTPSLVRRFRKLK